VNRLIMTRLEGEFVSVAFSAKWTIEMISWFD
jgi:hypothetical protein